MTLNELRYVVAVARERHFGHAAEACFVSQPTLSVAVRKLEDELGVTLFERGPGEVTVTEVGREIVAQAQRVLEEAEGIRRVARHGQNPLAGPLRLGAVYTVGPYLLPHLIPLVMQRAPDMPLMIEENFTARLAERLKRGDLDLIIISLPFDEAGVLTRPLYDEEFVVLMPVGHPWQARARIDIADLGEANLLLLGPGHCFRDQVLDACPRCRQSAAAAGTLQRNLEGGSLETIRLMVASGVGVTVLPCTACGGDGYIARDALCARPFSGEAPKRRIALAWRRSFPRGQAVEVIAEAVRRADLGCVIYPEDDR